MTTRLRYYLSGLLLLGSLGAQAQDATMPGMAFLSGPETPPSQTSLANTGFGTNQYRTQYSLGEVLEAVSEDIAAELNVILKSMLADDEEGSEPPKRSGKGVIASTY